MRVDTSCHQIIVWQHATQQPRWRVLLGMTQWRTVCPSFTMSVTPETVNGQQSTISSMQQEANALQMVTMVQLRKQMTMNVPFEGGEELSVYECW